MDLPVYLDHAATTPLSPSVLAAMMPYLTELFGNPSAIHSAGSVARDAVECARAQVAGALGAAPEDIFFTGGGTEADNWAIKGVASSAPREKRHVLVSAIEHHAVLDPCLGLRETGFEVEVVPVDGDGIVSAAEVAGRVRSDTVLVCIMHANNEVGSIQPVEEIARACSARGVLVHCDAVQTFGHIPVNVHQLGVDLLAVSAHKLNGPKGVGALYVRRSVRMRALMDGGGQERGRRSGTINVAGVVGLGEAAAIATARLSAASEHIRQLRDAAIDGIRSVVPGARLCGGSTRRLPNNVHFCIPGIEAESLLLALDAEGVYASAGSACSAGSTDPSHVLRAMGLPADVARGALRITLGADTTREQIEYVVDAVGRCVGALRMLR